MKKAKRSISTLFHNLSFLSRNDIRGLLREDLRHVMFQSSFACFVANSNDIENGEEKSSAIDYVKDTGRFDMIPYRQVRDSRPFSCGFDETSKLPYVVHEGRNLYFPASWSAEKMSSMYKHFIEDEQLTGERYRTHAPHCYVADDFRIDPEDVLIDVGCAEGLLSFAFIQKISHVYLIENDPEWFSPIEASFKNYLGEKATMVRKTVDSYDSENTISLRTIIEEDPRQSFFIKMDIEGAEVKVLDSVVDYLRDTRKKIKLAVCCYHRQSDAKKIEGLVKAMGFSYVFSDGYILAPFYDPSEMYSLRRGVIRAKNF